MGNAVGIECCAFEDVLPTSFPKSEGQERKQGQEANRDFLKGTQPRYRSILWAWQYSLDSQDDLCTTHEALNLSQLPHFSDESGYVVLHLFLSPDIQSTLLPLEPNAADTTNTSRPPIGCMEIAVSAQQQLTPRGQSSSFGGIHSVANSLQSSEATKSAVQYDIYLWHGKECPPLVKANALAQAFDLDGRLKRTSLHDLIGLFANGRDTITPARFSLDPQDATDWEQHAKQSHLLTFLGKMYLSHLTLTKPATSSRISSKRPHSKSTKKSAVSALKDVPASLPVSPASKTRVIIHRKSPHTKEKKSRTSTRTTSDQNTKDTESTGKKSTKSSRQKSSKEHFTRLSMRSVSLPSHEIQRVSRLAQGLSPPGFQLDIGSLRAGSTDSASPPESKAAKIARYNKICSQITENLFIGSDLIAQSADVLQDKGITHILNCAGTVCENYHPDKFTYMMLYLYDGPQEDISGLFYDVIEFMDDAISQGGKVFVHCHQGVSRSSAMLILYLMWRENQVYQSTHERVKAIREIVNPNAGFTCQLLNWWNRRKNSNPRFYVVLPHRQEAPTQYMLREILQMDASELDPRGCFIVWKGPQVWIWCGSLCPDILRQKGRRYAQLLVRFENASVESEEEEGEETAEFCALFGVDHLSPPQSRAIYDDLYKLSCP